MVSYLVNGVLTTAGLVVATAGLLYVTVPDTNKLRQQMADEAIGSGFGGAIGTLVTSTVTSFTPIETQNCVLFKGARVGQTEYIGILGRWFQLPSRRGSSTVTSSSRR